jgi:hypothetical protein
MKTLTAILGTAFIMFVSVAAIDATPTAQTAPSVKAAQHADHTAGKGCCDKTEGTGMCARDGKDAKGCCDKPECCKDDCCKDGKCKDNCTCECCKTGDCCKHDGDATAAKKAGCCKKPATKKPALVASH